MPLLLGGRDDRMGRGRAGYGITAEKKGRTDTREQGREEQRRAGQAGHGLVGRGREGRQALGRPIFRRFELPSVCVFTILDPYVRRGHNNPLYIPRRVVNWPLVLLGGHIASSLMIVRLGIGRE